MRIAQISTLSAPVHRETGGSVESVIWLLTRELSRAVGLGGRSRKAASATERARQTITKTIKSVLERIAQSDATLGDLLSRCVKTGTFCSYLAAREAPLVWRFSIGGSEASAETDSTPPILAPRDTSLLRAIDRTTFVGREEESAALRSCLERAIGGEGNVVVVGGPAGVANA